MKDTYKLSQSKKLADIAYIALFTALISVSSWIYIPASVPFTLQTFSVFCACLMLGGKRALISVTLYILLGSAGLPVFSGFRSGVYCLFDLTGGYITGFILIAVVYTIITKLFGSSYPAAFLAMTAGLFVLYISGSAWFALVYLKNSGKADIIHILKLCVIPYIVPDMLKMLAAGYISKRITDIIKI